MGVTEQVRAASEQLAREAGRPLVYLPSSSSRKEDEARCIAQRDGIREGLICVLTSVEPCFSYDVGPNRDTKRLELRGGSKKCLHQYFRRLLFPAPVLTDEIRRQASKITRQLRLLRAHGLITKISLFVVSDVYYPYSSLTVL